MRAFFFQVAFLGVLACLCVSGLGAGREIPALLPKSARWTDLPTEVRNVVIDHGGRAWFELSGELPEEQLKAQVERAVGLKAPWVRGACLLLVDARNRVWLLPNTGQTKILCYDPAGHTWTEHPLWRDPNVPQDPGNLYPHGFRTEVHESRSGTIYFGGRLGIYTNHGDDWKYQPVFEMNVRKNLYATSIRTFNPIHFAESDDGRVYAWSVWGICGWSGTVGAWVHDGHQWHAILTTIGDEKMPGRIQSLTPLGGGEVLVCPDASPAAQPYIIKVSGEAIDQKRIAADVRLLGGDAFDEREKAQQRLVALGTGALPALQDALEAAGDPEVRARLDSVVRALSHRGAGVAIDGQRFDQASVLTNGYHGVRDDCLLWGLGRPQLENDGGVQAGHLYAFMPGAKLKMLGADAVNISQATGLMTQAHGLVYGSRGRGVSIFKDNVVAPVTGPTESAFFNVVACDGAGRIFVADRVAEGGGLRPYQAHWAVLDLRRRRGVWRCR